MNILPFPRAEARDEYSSIQFKVEKYQAVSRRWAGHLTSNEMAVVEVLLDRTVGWGRPEAYFTIRALLNGDKIYSGLTMSRSTLFRTLKKLEGRGLITRRKDASVPDRVHFMVDLHWVPDGGTTVSGLPNRQCQDDTTQCHDDTHECHDDTLYTGINLQGSKTGNQARPSATLSLIAKNKVRGRSSGSAAVLSEPASQSPTTLEAAVNAVETAWWGALDGNYPGTAYRTWDVRQKGQIKKVLRTWRGDCTLPEFVAWAVANWTAIVRKAFRWMINAPPPATPAFSFFIAFIDEFADARAEGVLEDWLSAEDRTQIEKMIGRGQTYEQATAELGRQKAAVALRDEMTKREIAVRARDYGATRRLAEAQRLAELKGGIPIHRRSPAALRLIEEERRAARPTPTRQMCLRE